MRGVRGVRVRDVRVTRPVLTLVLHTVGGARPCS